VQYRSGRVPEAFLGAPVPGLRAGGDVLVGGRVVLRRRRAQGPGTASFTCLRFSKRCDSCSGANPGGGPVRDPGHAQPWRCLWRRFSQMTMTRP